MMDEIQNDAYLYSVGTIALYKSAAKEKECSAYVQEMKEAGAVSLKLAETSDVKENSDFADKIREAEENLKKSLESLKKLNYKGEHADKKMELLILGKALNNKLQGLIAKLIY